MGLIWAKSLYGAHVGLEWDKCPDSAYMGPTYTCLLGIVGLHKSVVHRPSAVVHRPLLAFHIFDISSKTVSRIELILGRSHLGNM